MEFDTRIGEGVNWRDILLLLAKAAFEQIHCTCEGRRHDRNDGYCALTIAQRWLQRYQETTTR
jgi:hypothetical protein